MLERIFIGQFRGVSGLGWIGLLGSSTNDDEGSGIAVDTSGNVYVCGSSAGDIQIAKYNTAGSIQWQRKLASGGNSSGYGIAVDSSGNVYVCGSYLNDQYFQIAKYNTSGTIQWQRRLGGTSYNVGYSIAVDTSGNVYVCGVSNASGTNDLQIAKYNTSGTIQWQRRFGGSTNDEYGSGIAVDSSGNIYVCGASGASGTRDLLLAKLPDNGSLTGTYNVGGKIFTYVASTLTNASTSLTTATASGTAASTSLTSEATGWTDSATTLTSSVTII